MADCLSDGKLGLSAALPSQMQTVVETTNQCQLQTFSTHSGGSFNKFYIEWEKSYSMVFVLTICFCTLLLNKGKLLRFFRVLGMEKFSNNFSYRLNKGLREECWHSKCVHNLIEHQKTPRFNLKQMLTASSQVKCLFENLAGLKYILNAHKQELQTGY